MLSYKSFIDLLFILLLSTIVLLMQSVRVGSLDLSPAKIGIGGVSRVKAGEVRVVVIAEEGLKLDDRTWPNPRELAEQIAPGDTALLIGGSPDVHHHRVMRVWSRLKERGVRVKLGVKPASEGAKEPSS